RLAIRVIIKLIQWGTSNQDSAIAVACRFDRSRRRLLVTNRSTISVMVGSDSGSGSGRPPPTSGHNSEKASSSHTATMLHAGALGASANGDPPHSTYVPATTANRANTPSGLDANTLASSPTAAVS